MKSVIPLSWTDKQKSIRRGYAMMWGPLFSRRGGISRPSVIFLYWFMFTGMFALKSFQKNEKSIVKRGKLGYIFYRVIINEY